MTDEPDEVRETETLIDRLGVRWPVAGWVLFATWFLGVFVLPFAVAAVAFVAWLIWWIADVVYVEPAPWQIVTGAAMIAIGLLPRGGTLIIAAWVLYWTRVREV